MHTEPRLAEIELLQSQMKQVREDLEHEVHDLVESARTVADWRRQWRKHPWALAAAAVAAGYLVIPSRRFAGVDSPQARVHSASIPSPTRRLMAEAWGSLLGLLARRGVNLLGAQLEQILTAPRQRKKAEPVSGAPVYDRREQPQ